VEREGDGVRHAVTLWVAVGRAALAALPAVVSPLIRMRDLPGPEDAHDDDVG
jgi:hypothetical protein